jgi:hypothetical protein
MSNANRLTLMQPIVDESATRGLQALRSLRAKNHGDLNSAVISAAYYARKTGETMYVYSGNSYGSGVWRVSAKPSEYLNPINNTGSRVASVTPTCTLSWSQVYPR